MSLFLKENQMFCPLKQHQIDQKYSVDVHVVNDYCSWKRMIFNGLSNTTCHWNTGVMVADNGPLYSYVDIPLKNLPFPATIVIYNIKNVYTVFLINLMLF